jgi:mannan endo-1,4-beta-mannosidase
VALATALLIALACLSAPAGASASGGQVALGAYVPHADENASLIDSFAAHVGWHPLIVSSFKTFDQTPVYAPQLDGIHEKGAVPMITWEPQTSSEGPIRLSNIVEGRYDGYLGDAARDAVAWGKPLMIRFGQEMNGAWYPWSPAHGNSARSYVQAWRHIVRLFRREGARNVKWVWTPYVGTDDDLPFGRFYPGDRYVDWAGLDGYNWGGSFPWRSFHDLFDSSYRKLLRLTSRPLMIGEVGCGEIGGNKAAWLRQMLATDIPRMSHVRALVWFDDTDIKGDLRVDTSGAALSSFRRWTGAPIYSSSRRLLLRTPKRFLRTSGRIGLRATR